jgi:phosphatidylinositol 4-kinase A
MYSLLNYIAATSKELHDNSSMTQLGHSLTGSDDSTMDSVTVGLRGLSDEDKRLVGISTISVVTRLALEFEMDEVFTFNPLEKTYILTFSLT